MCSLIEHLFHHYFELLKSDLAVVVGVALAHEVLPDLVGRLRDRNVRPEQVRVATAAAQQLLYLLYSNATVLVYIKQVESRLQLVVS